MNRLRFRALLWAPAAALPSLLAVFGGVGVHGRGWIAILGDCLLWGVAPLVVARAAPRVRSRVLRGVASALLALTLVVQTGALYNFHLLLDGQMAIAIAASWGDVRPVLLRALPLAFGLFFALATAVFFLAEGAFPRTSAKVPKAQKVRAIALVACGMIAVGGPAKGSADARLLAALPSLVRAFATPRGPVDTARIDLPAASTTEARLPHILFVFGESLRADDFRELLPQLKTPARFAHRVDLLDHQTPASYTVLAAWSAFTGVSPFGKEIHTLARVPTLFDVAKAVRDSKGSPLDVTYASSQRRDVLLRPSTLVGVHEITLVDLLGHEVADEDDVVDRGLDQKLADRYFAGNEAPSGPSIFSVVHLSGTHAPYYVDPSLAPYSPWSHTVSWSGLPALHNAYRNAILAQDAALAKMVDSFLRRAGNEPWIVFFTADHGEAFGEHAAIHHGQNLHEEQARVPAYIAFGNGALRPDAEQALRTYAARRTTHFDWLPTLISLLGVHGSPGLLSSEKGLIGRSLVGAVVPLSPLPIGNCSAAFACPLDNWGAMDETRTLYGLPWDGDYACWSAAAQGERPLPLEECKDLRAVATGTFGHRPGEKP